MRLHHLALAFFLVIAITACSTSQSTNASSGTVSPQRQRNIVADNVLISVFESGDVAKLDAIIDPAFINHAGTGDRVGLDSLKTGVKTFQARMKSVKVDRKRQFADDEYVSDWVRFIGVDTTMVIEGMEVTRYANGNAIEHWFFPNNQGRRN